MATETIIGRPIDYYPIWPPGGWIEKDFGYIGGEFD